MVKTIFNTTFFYYENIDLLNLSDPRYLVGLMLILANQIKCVKGNVNI